MNLTRPAVRTNLARGAVVCLGSFLLGGLTSYAQGLPLPFAVQPFANSASGWTLLTALLLFWSRVQPKLAAFLGAASFVLLVLGYTAAAAIRGYTYSPVLFGVIGLVVGPFVGVAAVFLRETGMRAALGTAVLSGIGVGEGVYGLIYVADTTGYVYWVASIVAGIALLALMLVRGARTAAVAALGTALVAGAFVVVNPLIS
ncbi:DUF6518 family protein [Amycolatopsis jejuensis]|uniref:DUF6518 family protein n=1 Tax=Amycolatopsis jejuensis TaxID=330084 RepID=UPI0005246AFC|nr:DUF6518 family protein [Amycolatopsis jejuensis]